AVVANPKILSGITIQAIGSDGVLSNVTLNGTLNLNGNNVGISLFSGDVSTGTVKNSGALATLTVTGGGTFGGNITGSNTALTVDGGNQTLVLSGSDSYGGLTTINSGDTLLAASSTALSSTSDISDNGTLDLGGFSYSIGALSGSGTVTD